MRDVSAEANVTWLLGRDKAFVWLSGFIFSHQEVHREERPRALSLVISGGSFPALYCSV